MVLAASSVDVVATTQAFHAQRLASLQKPEGWLSVVGLLWLKPGDNAVGSAADNGLQCPAGWPAHLGHFTPTADGVDVAPDPSGQWTLGGKPFAGGHVKVEADGESDRFAFGELRVSILRRGDRTGLRLRDRTAVARAGLKDIPMYPPTAAWRIEGRFSPAPKGATLPMLNVLGMASAEPTPGSVSFEVGGQTLSLAATLEDDGTLFFVFGDQTNGDTTYGSGRFLDAAPAKDGVVVLDFNQATNPPCAFTAFATCPVPPKGNRLPVRIEAGEKLAGHH